MRPRCGDGALDPGEACDDSNAADGDGCSAACEIEVPPRCGDGALDPGEPCDDGNVASGDGCEVDCTKTPAQEIVGEALAPFAQGTCEVVAGAGATLIRGTVLTPGAEKPVKFDTFPLDDASGRELVSGCGYPGDMVRGEDIDGGDAYCPHIAEGIEASARNEFVCLHAEPNDVLLPQSAYIHGIGLTAPDYAAMAAKGTALIWSPRSNITLYGDTAVVTAAARLGVQIALGTDWIATGSMNLLRELRCASSTRSRRRRWPRSTPRRPRWRRAARCRSP
ncbi:DUF4215 domain-containing protein [Sorangium sp. So ce590]|uniref:DUF4215 domain-containing protein n=1 Tax=unclassified Sorangium TaxID=2621164 RepID=UPI003F62B6AF